MSLNLSVAPNLSNDGFTSQQRRLHSPLTFVAANVTHSARQSIETFITNGFAARYNARITSFMPMLFALEVNGIKAAVGARCGATGSMNHVLFIEQYLVITIESVLLHHGISAKRHEIVEVGNLFSSSSRYTLTLLLSLCFLFSQVGKKHLVFSATKQLKELLQGAGISLTALANADAKKLESNHDDWGTYYDTAPQVMTLSLRNVTHHVMRSAPLRKYYLQAIGLIAGSDNEQQLSDTLVCNQKGASHVA
ncbi:thermostable hemolysin [Alteromonas sp. CI.11.F.A3]|uniref:thermostable hemolysin n=1 Tax=Alteromonas sp. CI.11.F.A3 TaxID=3079555 RepID=UPI0029425E7A|nr:thermostable hemolysin [Alteromonas sp. CI.11.F.A3]WOI38934.1 thermostable hemolysin [Alteromonas sp. CI.11.F.A3]